MLDTATPGPWGFGKPEKHGGRWPEPNFIAYTIYDDGLHGGTETDLDLIVALRNKAEALLDCADLLAEARQRMTLHADGTTDNTAALQTIVQIDAALARLSAEET